MKVAILALGMSLVTAGSAIAQRAAVISGGGVSGRAFGSRGGPAPALHSPFLGYGTTFAQRLGATVGGFSSYRIGGRLAPRGARGPGRPLVIPYAVPIYYGGYGYTPRPPQQTFVTVVHQPAPSPSVIINEYYSPDKPKPVVRDYTNAALPEPGSSVLRSYQAPVPPRPKPEVAEEKDPAGDARPTVYLIAYKDNSIYPAVVYWIEGDTLHYITRQGVHRRSSVDVIDKEFSEQLNRERNVEFKLAIAR